MVTNEFYVVKPTQVDFISTTTHEIAVLRNRDKTVHTLKARQFQLWQVNHSEMHVPCLSSRNATYNQNQVEMRSNVAANLLRQVMRKKAPRRGRS